MIRKNLCLLSKRSAVTQMNYKVECLSIPFFM